MDLKHTIRALGYYFPQRGKRNWIIGERSGNRFLKIIQRFLSLMYCRISNLNN